MQILCCRKYSKEFFNCIFSNYKITPSSSKGENKVNKVIILDIKKKTQMQGNQDKELPYGSRWPKSLKERPNLLLLKQVSRQGGGVRRVRSHPPRAEKVRLEVTCSAENVNLWKKNRQRWFVTVSSVLFCCRSLRTVFVLLIYLPRRTDYERIGTSIKTVQ